jgi:hypothetical protein
MNQFRPVPKPQKSKNRAIINYVVNDRDGVCLYGMWSDTACTAGTDPHHIIGRGAGGADTPENLITLCRGHHQEAQENKIPRGHLRQCLETYHKYVFTEDELAEGVPIVARSKSEYRRLTIMGAKVVLPPELGEI